ncbi:MAG TPA: magnesium/cobalt transporter CorA [Ideonella sp.]|jgi:magnesium transporter|nr:magnesium/cobalt transporter CorA [Ideonella sp.]
MLINCVAYEDGRKLADITVEDISDYLVRPGCFVWVALRDATDDELAQMQVEFGLHELAVEDARHGHQRPKLEEYGGMLFMVMHLLEPEHGELHIGEVDIFVGSNFVLSIRNRSTQHFLGVRERCEREPQLLRHGAGFVFYALMDAVVDRYFPLLDAIETELDTIETQIFEQGAARWNIERLYGLKRRATVLRHAVAPLLEASSKLHGGRVPAVCAQTQEYFRDVNDHLARINASIDAIRDTIGTAIQVNLSMVTIEESETTKRLAAWAAIFAVSTALAGVWGMNFEGMPELKWTYGYPLALGLIAGAAGLLYWRFKRAGWL